MATAVLERTTESTVRPLSPPQVEAQGEFEPTPRLWTREEYYQLAETGLFSDGKHVELIEGMIVNMSPVYEPHFVSVTTRLRKALFALEGPGRHLRLQGPLSLGPDYRPSDPEPDGALVEGEPEDYEDAGHAPTSALLVIEVSEASLKRDRGWKSSLYASAGIQEYWIIDLNSKSVEVRRHPQPAPKARFGSDYSDRSIYEPGATVSCLADPDVHIPVAAFFRKPKQS
jgi:Uma2 family endonuclease